MAEKEFHSTEDVMREFFPNEYERRKREGRCVLCGAERKPSPLDVLSVSAGEEAKDGTA